MDGIFQPTHLILILIIVVVFFGGKKLPELGKGLGQAIRGFKQSMHEDDVTQGADRTITPGNDTTKPVN